MPVIYGEAVPAEMPFPEVETKRMVDGDHGSTSITAILKTIHPGGSTPPTHRHKAEAGIYVYEGHGHLLIEGEGEYEVV